jgi:FG-GAP repeat protein/putative Ig domain-containing protein
MRTAKSRVIIRRIIVLSLLLFLGLATPHNLQWTNAESDATNDGLPTLRGEAALIHLKERGLYASLGEAVKAARYNAQPLPPDIAPLLAGSLRLEAADGAAEDYFGAAVAISGNTAIVGAPRNDINGAADQGAAYIFVRSGRTWTQEDKLKAPTGAAGDFFGGSVAISGNTAIVGAYLNDIEGIDFANQGSVYIFTRSAGVWTQQDKLMASDGAANDLFGFSVAIDGDTAIVGAPLADAGVNVNQGAVYIFTRGGGEVFSETAKLTAPNAAGGDLFGVSVAIDAETVVIGASGRTERGEAAAGAAYVFALSGGAWTAQQKLLPDISAADNFFGAAVAVSGDTALIGSFGDDIGANTNQGAAVVFVRSGSTWTKQEKLTAADGSAEDKFGMSVALSGDTAVIGAIGDDVNGADQGSAYVFSRTGVAWSQQPRLLDTLGGKDDKFGAPVAISCDTVLIGASFDDIDGNANQGSASAFVICQGLAEQQKLTAAYGAEDDYFGDSVAISGDTVIVGAPENDIGGNADQGSANIFIRSGATWTHQQRLTAADGAANDDFGNSVAISGDTVVVGAIFDDPGGNSEQGSAYVFVRNGPTWTQQQKLTASDGAQGDHFSEVAISGDTLVVGAFLHDIDGNQNQGAAYVFTRNGATWTQQQKLIASDGAGVDFFASSVAISGDTVVIGADSDDIGGNADQGSVYVFTRSGATWTQQEKLTASGGAADDHFGGSVAICGDTIVAGATHYGIYPNASQGWAYIFERSGATWTQQQRLTASDIAANSIFGISVAISGDTVVVGTGGSQDSVYFFERSGETWTERQILTASDGATFDSFASTIAISGDSVVVGAQYADVGANEQQGAAYVFAGVACPGITLDPPSLRNGTAGSAYNWSITATGGSGHYNYSVSSGTLPAGLTLNPTTGSLSGRPVMAGSYDFTITATDGSLCPGSHDYTLVIDCPVISVSPANPNLPPGQVGASYNRGFTANGGLSPYSFSVSAGALPAGLTLDPATSALSGAPTASGTFNFAIRATDSGGCSGATAYVLTVNCPTIQINPANPNLPNGTAGAPFNGAFTVMGGTAPYSFSITNGALPGGLTLDAATGELSGAPTATGAFNFAVRVADGYGCFGSRAYVLTINCPTINIEPANSNLPNGVVGTPYNQAISTRGGAEPITLDVVAGAAPGGLTLNAATGVLSGAPTARGIYNFVIRATDSNGCVGRRQYQIIVN